MSPYTFAGAPFAAEGQADYGVLGAPSNLGSTTRGGAMAEAPRAIRLSYAAAAPENLIDLGDVEPEKRNLEHYLDQLTNEVKTCLEQIKQTLLVLGGDDSVSYSVVRAVSEFHEGPVDLVHFDAHKDEHPDLSMGIDHSNWVTALKNGNLIVSDVERHGYRMESEQPSQDLEEQDPTLVVDMAAPPVARVVVLDMGAIDPAFAPGVAAPEPFGLTPVYVLETVSKIVKEGNVRAIVLTEVDPSRDINEQTSRLAFRFLYNLITR
ncbi:arginase family protein [Populibacterium corticicola]|uniref:Arginase family protein n=1 Tax=Populibacterium corticicola TaxID=1812826 RepID=A0ABW5XEE1_9MICO